MVIQYYKYKKERKLMFSFYVCVLVLLSASALLEQILVSTIVRSIELLALGIMFFCFIRLWRMKSLCVFAGVSKKLVIGLFVILLSIIVRGNWEMSGHYLFLKLLKRDGFLAYFIPIMLVSIPNSRHLKTIAQVLFVGSLLSFPLWVMNATELVQDGFRGEGVGAYMPFLAAFLLGFPLISKRQRKICFVIWAIYLLLMMLNARRNMIFSLGGLGLIAYYCCNLSRFAKNRGRAVLVAVAAAALGVLFLISNIDVLEDKVFNRFAGRLEEDTRSGVEELFLADFSTSPISDWIWGRGIDGGYYQEVRDDDTGEVNTNRLGIETGYLNNILKGGAIYSIFIISIMLACFIRSIKIKNIYSFYLRWVFLLFFIDLYATTLMGGFSPKSVMFWLFVSVALCREYPFLGRTDKKVCQNGKNTNLENNFM